MNKKAAYTYNKGMIQDITKSKHPADAYYDAKNIRIINTDAQSSYSVTNEKGDSLQVTLPTITVNNGNITYGNETLSFANTVDNELLNSTLPSTSSTQQIIGHAVTRDSIILFSTDNLGFDCIWEITDIFTNDFNLKLLYCRDLDFSTSNPIQAIFNYENSTVQKIYWVDGINQLRFLNIKHSKDNGDSENLIDLNSTSINIVSDYSLSQPELTDISSGGVHTSGMVQYSYNLYRLSGSQTTISPFSQLISLDRGAVLGGGEVNEIVGSTPFMTIPALDNNYTHIRIYAIKYTSYNQIPSISLILDEEIDSYEDFTFSDDGNTILTLSLSEFLFLGSNPIKPKHIETKDNRLFAMNYSERVYDLDIDMRAYGHDTSGATRLYTGNVNYSNGNLTGANISFSGSTPIENYNYNTKFDAVNPDYYTYRYQKNGLTFGGEGLYIKYQLLGLYETSSNPEFQLEEDLKYARFFKYNEVYRIGIQFYNKLGQKTDVKWIADFKAPWNPLAGLYNGLKVEIKETEFNAYINSLNLDDNDKPVGYRIVRAERTLRDKTILCQGSATQMIYQVTPTNVADFNFWNQPQNFQPEAKLQVKIPTPLTRGFIIPSTEDTLQPTRHFAGLNNPPSGNFDEVKTEIYTDADTRYKRQRSWNYTKMVQVHSPDVLFDTGIGFGAGLEFKPIGIARHSQTNKQYKQFKIDTKAVERENREDNQNKARFDSESAYFNYGFVGPIYDGAEENLTEQRSFNRQYYTNASSNNNTGTSIYGTPEITERGQGVTLYNGDAEFKYANTLEGMVTDAHKDSNDDPELRGLNSFGSKCLTVVLGGNGTREEDRPTLESLLPSDIISGYTDGLMMVDIARPESYIYNGAIYGGTSYEDKTRSTYVEIGKYQNITETTAKIDSPGDTYVQNYKFARLAKTDTEVFDVRVMQFTEIVEHIVETSVNLENRSDISLLNWDNKFQPQYSEFHDYNRVYSQDANLIVNTTDSFTFREVQEFDNKIISSNIKLAGENIDSWTDFLENDTMELDGKYGSINSVVNFNDNIFVFQDTALAALSINPRIQTQGSDGISIELGTGNILYDYNYLTTKSGTLNKWSVVSTPTGFYYYDLINKELYKFSGQLDPIGTSKGLHKLFQNNSNYSDLIVDNPILRQGVTSTYDDINKEALFTFLQGDKSFSIGYNDKNESFTSQYEILPSMYMTKGSVLASLSTDNNKIYQHFQGNYNVYHGVTAPSYITLLVNPESNLDCIFNNIEFNSEIYIDDIDQSENTITHIQAFNEYQDSGRIPLVLGRSTNLRRKFRKWRADIPREGRERMRNPWVFLKLELENNSNQKLILHDIIVSYSV